MSARAAMGSAFAPAAVAQTTSPPATAATLRSAEPFAIGARVRPWPITPSALSEHLGLEDWSARRPTIRGTTN